MKDKGGYKFYSSEEVVHIIEKERPDIIDEMKKNKVYTEMSYAIIKARLEKKLTQEQLSELSGISQVQISRMENGNIGSLRTLLKLLKVLQLTIKIIPIDQE